MAINFNFVCQSCEVEIIIALDESDAGEVVQVGCGNCGHINGQLVFSESVPLLWEKAVLADDIDVQESRNGNR